MSSQPTTSLRLEKQGQGDNPNDWGPRLNNVIDMLDDAIAGFAQVNVAAPITLSSNTYQTDQARKMVLRLTGPGGFAITVPTVPKMYFIDCQTTNDCTIKTSGGTAATIVKGTKRIAYCDGTNMVTDTSVTSSAAATAFTPYGNLAATNVQGALQELDDEKAPKASPIFTGGLSVAPNATGAGTVSLVGGYTTRSGYMEIAASGGVRVGYIGNASTTDIELAAENGRLFNFLGGVPKVDGKSVSVKDTDHRATAYTFLNGGGSIYNEIAESRIVVRTGSNVGSEPYRYTIFDRDGGLTVAGGVGAANYATRQGDASGALYLNAREATGGGNWTIYSQQGWVRFFSTQDNFRFQADGNLWSRSLGFLSDALNYRLPYDNPTAGGQVFVNGGSSYGNVEPSLKLYNGGKIHIRIRAANDGYTRISNGDSGAEYFAFGTAGDIWRAGEGRGDLDTQIETRAAAWAATRQAPISVSDVVGTGNDTTRRVYFNGVCTIAGTSVVTTNGDGFARVTFPWQMAQCEGCVAINGDGYIDQSMYYTVVDKNSSGFTIIARNVGGNVGVRTVRVNYIATGTY